MTIAIPYIFVVMTFAIIAALSIKKSVAGHYAYTAPWHPLMTFSVIWFGLTFSALGWVVFTGSHFAIGIDPRIADLETRIEIAEKLCGAEAK